MIAEARCGASPQLNGAVALVTGGGSGIGAATALALANAGSRVAVADIDVDAAQATVQRIAMQGGTALATSLDVTSRASCDAAADIVARELGTIGVVVNSAGVSLPTNLDDPELIERFAQTLQVNTTGTLNVVRAALPQLREHGGSIVNLASIASFIAGSSSVAYGTSKGAVAQMTKFLARDLAPASIRVNAVAPGVVDTSMTVRVRSDPARLGRVIERTMLKRLATPDEIARPIVFLASSWASYITGTILIVDGGYLAG